MMNPQHLLAAIQQQRNAAMDNVAMLAVERDALKERVAELEALLAEKQGEPS